MNNPHTTSENSRALIAVLALGLTGSVGFAADAHYYVNDPLATTVAISDAAGEIAAIEADAFGAPLAAGEAPSRYTGKPYDADLGAYVFPFRNYRPEEGRWMSADPSGFPDGVNGQIYTPEVFSNVDPLGLLRLDTATRIGTQSITLYNYNLSYGVYKIKANDGKLNVIAWKLESGVTTDPLYDFSFNCHGFAYNNGGYVINTISSNFMLAEGFKKVESNGKITTYGNFAHSAVKNDSGGYDSKHAAERGIENNSISMLESRYGSVTHWE